MLIAVADGRRLTATPELRGSRVSCPACGTPLIVRLPATRVPHFAHLPGQVCPSRLAATARLAARRKAAAERRARIRLDRSESAGQETLFDLTPGQ